MGDDIFETGALTPKINRALFTLSVLLCGAAFLWRIYELMTL